MMLVVTYNMGAMLVTMVLRIAMFFSCVQRGLGGPPGAFVGGSGMLRNAGRGGSEA
jgi:hypothetical protein